jgi:K(+)-stimulated pyrophosphate-energized sodium pump
MNPIYIVYAVPVLALLTLFYAYLRAAWVRRQDPGNERMQLIGKWIAEGARAFLYREYKFLVWFVIIVAILLGVSNHFVSEDTNAFIALSFVLGGLCSALAGYFGMMTATASNYRAASAARQGLNQALKVAFTGGSVMGLCVVGLALLGLVGLFMLYTWMYPDSLTQEKILVLVLNNLSGFSLGASSVALFARVGGGIYTKSADVGADLVGKVEAGIPEDHPLNPATIADNVGDDVGDVAGMGADLFESYVGAIISTMILAVAWIPGLQAVDSSKALNALYLPLVVAVVGVISSIIGFFFVKVEEGGDPQKGLNRGTFVSGALMLIGTALVIWWMIPQGVIQVTDIITGRVGEFQWWGVMLAVIAGLIAGIAVGMFTEYYTAMYRKPVMSIVEGSKTGPATTTIQGIAVGMNSTTWPVLFIGAAILVAYYFSGLYGVALAGVGMLSTLAIQLSTDAYGPIADNAGGVAEMSKLGREVRARTDRMDAVGNTTAAIGKGFAIGSAALTALALTAAYITKMQGKVEMDAANPYVLVGLLIGCMLPFKFSAMALVAVGKAAQDMIQEVRRQFREIAELRPALMAAKKAEDEDRDPNEEEKKIIAAADGKAQYAHCVDIATSAAIKKMIAPGLMAIIVPVLVGLYSPHMLGGLLVGVTISGVCLAIFQANAGGAWDNAKKQVKEEGPAKYGEEAYAIMKPATVACDTVGDPFKDTSGPSLNILLKLISVIAMILAPIFYAIHFGG